MLSLVIWKRDHAHLPTAPFQGVIESDEVSPKLPFLQALVTMFMVTINVYSVDETNKLLRIVLVSNIFTWEFSRHLHIWLNSVSPEISNLFSRSAQITF